MNIAVLSLHKILSVFLKYTISVKQFDLDQNYLQKSKATNIGVGMVQLVEFSY